MILREDMVPPSRLGLLLIRHTHRRPPSSTIGSPR